MTTSMFRIALCLSLLFSGTITAAADVTAPPAAEIDRLSLDPFYQKYTQVRGFPIISSGNVDDAALLETAYLIENMIGHRPDLLDAMTSAKLRFVGIAHNEFTTQIPEYAHLKPKAYWDKRARGLGPTEKAPAVSAGEENILSYRGDPYEGESIVIHEFAHAIHLMGINVIDPNFDTRLEETYAQALANGLWQGTYAETNPREYWAEGVQSWFGANDELNRQHNHVNTRRELIAYDPALAQLIEEFLGEPELKYAKPSERRVAPAHLEGFEHAAAPRFAWPDKLLQDFKSVDAGHGAPRLPLLPLTAFGQTKSVSDAGPSIVMTIWNQSDDRLDLKWIDPAGAQITYQSVIPGRKIRQQTYSGHAWALTRAGNEPVALFRAGDVDAWVEIE